MKRKDTDEINNHFPLSSPPLKIRRLAPIIEEQEVALVSNDFVDKSMETSVPVNDERAIVLYNPKNDTPRGLPCSSIPYAESDFLSRFKNHVIWSKGSDTPISLADETYNQDENLTGCMAVVPWVPRHLEDTATNENLEAVEVETSDIMDSDEMEVEDDYNTGQQMSEWRNVTTSVTPGWNVWQQHCMIQQPPNNYSTPVSWFG